MLEQPVPSVRPARQNNTKDNLINAFKFILKLVQLSSVREGSRTINSSISEALCCIIEAILLHKLQPKSASRVIRFLKEQDSKTCTDFWHIITAISHKSVVNDVLSRNNIKSDIGKSRSWVRSVLNEKELGNYFMILTQDAGLCSKFYKKAAVINDPDAVAIISSNLSGIYAINFDLPVNSSILNAWSSAVLLATGKLQMEVPLLSSDDVVEGEDVFDEGSTVSVMNGELSPSFVPCFGSSLGSDSVYSFRMRTGSDDSLDQSTTTPFALSDSTLKPPTFNDSMSSSGHPFSDSFQASGSREEEEEEECEVEEQIPPNIDTAVATLIDNKPVPSSDPYQLSQTCDDLPASSQSVAQSPPLNTDDVSSDEGDPFEVEKGGPTEETPERPSDFGSNSDVRVVIDKVMVPLPPPSPSPPSRTPSPASPGDFVVISPTADTLLHKRFDRLYSSIPRRATLKSQDFACPGCGGVLLPASDGHLPPFCAFDNRFYCNACHTGQTALIPSQVILNWNLVALPVSRHAFDFLSLQAVSARIDFATENPLIYENVTELAKARALRKQLSLLSGYLLTCSQTTVNLVWRSLHAKDHLIYTVDTYSLDDLASLPRITSMMRKAVLTFTDHVFKCHLCSQKGFYCELCRRVADGKQPGILYPFQTDIVYACKDCNAVYHLKCVQTIVKDSGRFVCPKCRRRDLRSQ